VDSSSSSGPTRRYTVFPDVSGVRGIAAACVAAILPLAAGHSDGPDAHKPTPRFRGASAVLTSGLVPWVVVSQPRPQLLRLDPQSLRSTSRIRIGTHPDSSDATSSVVWVANTSGDGRRGVRFRDTVMSFDARTGRRLGVVGVPGVYRIAAWRRSVLAISRRRSGLFRVDHDGRRLRLAQFGNALPEDVDVAGGRLWIVTSRITPTGETGELRAYTPLTGRLLRRTRLRGSISQISATQRGVWGLGNGVLMRFSASGQETARVRVRDAVHLIADGESALVAGSAGVRQFNATGEPRGLVRTRAPVASLATAPSALYVLQSNEVVARIKRPQ